MSAKTSEFLLDWYREVDGIRTFRDSEIVELYRRLLAEGGAHVFRDGSVPDAAAFLRMAKATGTAFLVAHVRGRRAGVCWLNRFQGRWAQCNFFIFREFWGPDAAALGRWTLRELLHARAADGDYLFDMLVGVTPADNPCAVAFALRCGWSRCGVLPRGSFNAGTGASSPAVLLTATREALQ
jgi:hypothetical protein